MTTNLFPQELKDVFSANSTTVDATLYVATTGSDANDGSAAHPFATVDRAGRDYWRSNIRHNIKILVAAGAYASGWPTAISPTFTERGSLSVIGVGAPVVVSGPHTVTGAVNLGTGGQRLTIGAGGLGAVDSLCGRSIMLRAGSSFPGYVYQIVANTATTIDLILSGESPVNADTLNIVEPAVRIASSGFDLLYDARTVVTVEAPMTIRGSRLLISNLTIDASAASVWAPISLRGNQGGAGVSWGWVRLDVPAGTYNGVEMMDFTMPIFTNPVDDDYVTLGATGIANLAGSPLLTIMGGTRDARVVQMAGDVLLNGCVIYGGVITKGGSFQAYYSSWGCYEQYNSDTQLTNCFLTGLTAYEAAVSLSHVSSLLMWDCHIDKGVNAIKAKSGTNITLYSVSCSSTDITGSAVTLQALVRLTQKGGLANFVGASLGGDKAYSFGMAVVKSDTWIATSGTSATDGKGGFIARFD